MKHNEYRDMIQLYLFGELEGETKKLFEEHLRICSECAGETEKIRKLFSELAGDAGGSVSDELLAQARYEFRGYLKAVQDRSYYGTGIFGRISELLSRPWVVVSGAAAILILGFFSGYLYLRSFAGDTPSENLIQPDNFKIQNVSFLDSDPSDGLVELTYEYVQPSVLKGSIKDPEVQKILTYAVLNEQNPGTRLNSLNLINAGQFLKTDNEIRSALVAVAKYDENPGVRRAALKSLKLFPPDEEIKNTLLYVLLNDTSSGIRIEAVNSLAALSRREIKLEEKDLKLLRDKIQADANNYVRFQASNIIKEY